MTNPTIVSLAILKVNYDLGRDYLENFVPIVAECIRLSETDIVSIPEIQSLLRKVFGLRIPQNSIKIVLSRVRKRGFICKYEGAFKRVNENFEKLEFKRIQQEVLVMHEALIEKLIRFCSEKFNITWHTDEAEKAFEQYLDEHNLLTLLPARIQKPKNITKSHPKHTKYLIGTFIQHMQETYSPGFEYLETIVKGHMLANALFLIEPGKTEKKFRKTAIYFDTPFLIFSLGHADEARAAPCLELLDLLYEN